MQQKSGCTKQTGQEKKEEKYDRAFRFKIYSNQKSSHSDVYLQENEELFQCTLLYLKGTISDYHFIYLHLANLEGMVCLIFLKKLYSVSCFSRRRTIEGQGASNVTCFTLFVVEK
uniref:Uncharacterized protein n=1 Tax=Romanomermis culicivorax TaxID=13658 RepID=A0A915J4P3_ROMCU